MEIGNQLIVVNKNSVDFNLIPLFCFSRLGNLINWATKYLNIKCMIVLTGWVDFRFG
jgi:hypothetical protein